MYLTCLYAYTVPWHERSTERRGEGIFGLKRIVTRGETCSYNCYPAFGFRFPRETLAIASGVTPKEDASSSQEEGAGGLSLNQISSRTVVSVF